MGEARFFQHAEIRPKGRIFFVLCYSGNCPVRPEVPATDHKCHCEAAGRGNLLVRSSGLSRLSDIGSAERCVPGAASVFIPGTRRLPRRFAARNDRGNLWPMLLLQRGRTRSRSQCGLPDGPDRCEGTVPEKMTDDISPPPPRLSPGHLPHLAHAKWGRLAVFIRAVLTVKGRGTLLGYISFVRTCQDLL